MSREDCPGTAVCLCMFSPKEAQSSVDSLSRHGILSITLHDMALITQIFVCPCTCVFVCCVTECIQSLELDIRLKKEKKGDFNPQSCLNRCLNWCYMQIHTLSVD